MSKYLVVIRCGDNSLHKNWVNDNSKFDVILSYFGDNIPYRLDNIKYVHHFKGSKWEGLYDLFHNHQELWKDYDYVWLPDDDLDSTAENINSFLELVEKYQFDLCQPALTTDSYFSYKDLLQNNDLIYRETNFVEVMAPCFSKRIFLKAYQTFNENKSGWGLDFYWPILFKKENIKIGIIDSAPIHHTRPVGIAGHGSNDKNLSPLKELHQLLEKYSLKMPEFITSSILTKKGKVINKGSLRYFLRTLTKKDKIR